MIRLVNKLYGNGVTADVVEVICDKCGEEIMSHYGLTLKEVEKLSEKMQHITFLKQTSIYARSVGIK